MWYYDDLQFEQSHNSGLNTDVIISFKLPKKVPDESFFKLFKQNVSSNKRLQFCEIVCGNTSNICNTKETRHKFYVRFKRCWCADYLEDFLKYIRVEIVHTLDILEKPNMKEYFLRFLYQNEILEEFKKNLNIYKKGNISLDEHISYYLGMEKYKYIISDAFIWKNTTEGYKFWEVFNNIWIQELNQKEQEGELL